MPICFEQADILWRSLQDKMIKFIEANDGEAKKYSQPQIILRTGYEDVVKYFRGEIDILELRKRLGC